jgi:hypothetical protein
MNALKWIKFQADRYKEHTIYTLYKSMREKDQEELKNNLKKDDQQDLPSLDLSFDETNDDDDKETQDNVES